MSVRSLPPIPASSHKKPVSSDEATSNDVSQIDAASPAADETYSSNTDAFTAPRTLAMLVLALLPFWSVPLSHAWSNSNTATGFFQYELPYYVANGRAAFERGNGVSYPNPYDPSPAAPAIYAHWLPWTLGLLTAKLGCDAGDVMLALTLFASLAFAWATRQLVFHRVGNQLSGDPTFKEFAFLLSMWGGGLLMIAGSVFNVFQSESWLSSVLQFDPGNGMWFLNWGRNALFPTEAIYHTLVALCWLAEIQQRHKASNIFLLLLATTHPWSGLELLLTINLWRLLELNYYQNRRTLNQVSISAIMLVAFLGYYKIWLPRFAQHSELQNVWELNWSLTWSSAIPAYLLVVIPAAIIVMRKIRFASASSTAPAVPATTNTSNGAEATLRPHHPSIWTSFKSYSKRWAHFARFLLLATTERLGGSNTPRSSTFHATGSTAKPLFGRTEAFLLCALFIATGLAFHDRIIKPVQPLHFTRGYVWMPLFLLGVPLALEWFRNAMQRPAKWKLVTIFACCVLIADNFVFAIVHCNRQLSVADGFHLTTHERALLIALHESPNTVGRIAITESKQLNYLLPTYSNVRPWLGHHFNTPKFPERKATWTACFQNQHVHVQSIPDDVEIVIVRRSSDLSELVDSSQWQALDLPNAEWQTWRRR